jgi:hypothetical protein
VLHIKALTVDDAAELICRTVRKPNFETTPESQKILNDSLLTAKVHSALVKIAPKIIVTADDGIVSIGNTEIPLDVSSELSYEIKTIAEKIEGVEKVILTTIKRTNAHHTVNPFHNI